MAGKKLLRVGIFGLAIVLIVGALVHLLTPKEPSYQGRTLSEWLAAYNLPMPAQHEGDPPITVPTPRMQAAMVGIKAIGSNAVPILLKWLQATDSPTKIKINRLLDRQNFIHFRFQSVWKMNMDAQDAFFILRHDAHNAAPGLIQLTQSPDPQLRQRALSCLRFVEPEKNLFLPVLLQSLKDPSREVGAYAAFCLEQDYPEEIKKDSVLHILADQAMRNTQWATAMATMPPLPGK